MCFGVQKPPTEGQGHARRRAGYGWDIAAGWLTALHSAAE